MTREYTVTMTEKQIIVVEKAVEEYMRLRMGQTFIFALDMAGINMGGHLDPDIKDKQDAFDEYIRRRNEIERKMEQVYEIAFAPYGHLKEKPQDVVTAESVWQMIRYALGKSGYKMPEGPVIQTIEKKERR